ncbi:MAG: metallophosphoesterase [Paludibacteraceae bacterium]|nr:metallophosphoesterase [Paludibacteraceae bacterium]
MNACGRNGETFVFITDPHWQQNQHNSPYLIREVLNKTSINYVVCGGDLIGEGEHDPMVNLMHECVRALTIEGHKTYFAFGNHDSNWNAYGGQREHPERHFDNDTVWALISKPNDNAVVWMDGDRQNYYFDNSGTKTRTIIIDTGEDDSAAGLPLFTEFDELAAALMGTPEGWHIIIVGHIVTYGVMVNEVPKMCDAYNSKGTYATYDFASAKAKVSLLLGGHIHNDASRVSTGGIPIVATDCDSTATNTTSPAYAAGTVT